MTEQGLTAREVIKTLIDAYEAKIRELNSPNNHAFNGLRKVRDVFANQPNKDAVYELVALMMQPSTEEVFYNCVQDPLAKGKQNIQVNIKTGMGLRVDPDKQIEIFNFINGEEFNARRFTVAFANALTETMRRYKD